MDMRSSSEAPNPAAWLVGQEDIRVDDFPHGLKPLEPHEARVQMRAVGICGSDIHYVQHMRIADFVVTKPMVLGHESAGIVVEVGSDVTNLNAGDRVALEPGVPCRLCTFCKTGRYNLCPDMRFFATPPVHGSLTRYVVHPSDFCFPIPDELSLEEGAMAEPLSVGVHACNRAGVTVDSRVCVMGAGPIGLVTMLCAFAYGAVSVVITDVNEDRLSFVRQNWPHAKVLNVSGMNEEQIAEEVRRDLGRKPEIVFDCAGVQSTVASSLKSAANGGRVCLIGAAQNSMTLAMTSAATREIDVIGIFRYRNTYPTALQLMASKRVDVRPLITHRFDLSKDFDRETVLAGFNTSAAGGTAVKVMFDL